LSFARTIVEEHAVRDAIDAAIDINPRTEDVWDALKWRLARDPIPEEALILVNESDTVTYGVRTPDYRPLFPVIRAVARYNKKLGIKVEILRVEVIF
jgi:hypothetical protein